MESRFKKLTTIGFIIYCGLFLILVLAYTSIKTSPMTPGEDMAHTPLTTPKKVKQPNKRAYKDKLAELDYEAQLEDAWYLEEKRKRLKRKELIIK